MKRGLLTFLFGLVYVGLTANTLADFPPLPAKELYEQHMLEFGKKHCEALINPNLSFDEKLASTYYDATWVFLNIERYTNDHYWHTCAERSAVIYSNGYILLNQGSIPGYWKFTRGLSLLNRPEDQTAIMLTAQNGAFALATTPLSATADSTMSREVAYLVLTDLDNQRLGNPPNVKYQAWIDQIYGHFDQWFVSKTAPYVRPFMVALSTQALIEHTERYGDDPQRLLSRLRLGAQYLFTLSLPDKNTFQYTDRQTDTGGTEPAPDLNLLIVPIYGWLYAHTGDVAYLAFGDKVFEGGVQQAYLGNGKQFNQNYRWSMQYIQWRRPMPLEAPKEVKIH